jgi:hypothetical protein
MDIPAALIEALTLAGHIAIKELADRVPSLTLALPAPPLTAGHSICKDPRAW